MTPRTAGAPHPPGRVRLSPMTAAELAAWRLERRGTREAIPEPSRAEDQEALVVLVDGERVGRAVIGCTTCDAGAGGTSADGRAGQEHRFSVRALEVDLTSDHTEEWAEVLSAIADHARERGAGSLRTAVRPRLVSLFEAAGYRATATSHAKRLDEAPQLQEDRRVEVRPMDADERRQFALDARALVEAGTGSGLIDPELSPELLAAGLGRLATGELPADEVLMVGQVDGRPVGRLWGTLVRHDDALDFVGRIIELYPAFRGQRLTPSFLGAMARHLRVLGVRDFHVRVHGHDVRARHTFDEVGVEVRDVHLRRDLG